MCFAFVCVCVIPVPKGVSKQQVAANNKIKKQRGGVTFLLLATVTTLWSWSGWSHGRMPLYLQM